MLEILKKIKEYIPEIETDVIKFQDKGNDRAGKRARIGLSKVKRLSVQLRMLIQSKRQDASI